MSRAQRVANAPAASSAPSLLELPVSGGMLAWLTALLVARWLMPTEGAGEGLTLWLTQLVLFTAMARTAWQWRFSERPIRCDAMDIAMALLIGAQVISALSVVFGVGNARAAINLAWEWIGSGVLIWMLRQELTSSRLVRELSWGLSLTAAVLAGYGVWQHYIGYDQMSREYDRLTSEHDLLTQRLSGERALSASDARELQSLRAEMARQQIPIEVEARMSLEQRVKRSREPLGLFALANTFAGLLAAMLLITLGLRRIGLLERTVGLTAAVIIAFCLLLTKSRTAWVGLGAGVCWWILKAWLVIGHRLAGQNLDAHASKEEGSASGEIDRRGSVRTLSIVVGVIMLVGAFAALSGGLDKAVLSEAPKSLRYRLEYWQASWATIREHPILGTGPGNFRDYYLAHKLPESSEEIADPHNFLFDVWANAGILGLAGMMACVSLMAQSWFTRSTQGEQNGNVSWASASILGAGYAFPVTAIGMDLLGHGTDDRLWWLGGIWWSLWVTVFGWARLRRHSSDSLVAARSPFVALEAANVALLVHLLGAGGIAMPAVTQLLWLVWAMQRAPTNSAERAAFAAVGPAISARQGKSPSSQSQTSVMAGRIPAGAYAAATMALCLSCVWTATLPELLSRTALQWGDAEWEHRRIDAAQARYLEAAEADRWTIEPLERLAELAYQHWQQSQRADDFDHAIRWLENIRDRLPFASRPHRRIGQAWLARFEQSHAPEHARMAMESLATAVEHYPHHAELLSEWATACDGAGLKEDARDAARRALRQDDLNHQAGHADKYLTVELRAKMQRLANESSDSINAN